MSENLVKLDSGMSATLKYVSACVIVFGGLLVEYLGIQLARMNVLWTFMPVICGVLFLWFGLVGVVGLFRYRVWLEGTKLCLQKLRRVHRADLAEASSVEVVRDQWGVPFLVVRGGGREFLSVRMVTSRGRSLPRHQVKAVADAIAGGTAANVAGTEDALARLWAER